MIKSTISSFVLFLAISCVSLAQNVPILDFSVNNFGQVQLGIEAKADKYYVLTTLHQPNLTYESPTSITMGVDGNMIISEPLAAFPQQNYKITEHSIANPDDTDGDGIDDMTEFNDMPRQAPLNFAEAIDFADGTTSIDNAETFASMAVVADVPWAPFLNGQQFVKFGILDRDTDEPKVYFINSNTWFIHAEFFNAIPAIVNGDDGSGEIVFNPNEILPNGVIGSYSFNFSFGDAMSFEATQRTFELLAANMPFLQNNLQHFIGDGGEIQHETQYADDFIGSRINVVLESEVFGDIDYIPFNEAEGFGFFRKMELDENPGSRDIVLYDALPNSLPRVGGIITSVVQTPLSHVNLRAIQDNVPNAYIKEPLAIPQITNLLGKYIYYKVTADEYEIREASVEEVNEWYENIRPTQPQIPERDLSQTSILPLDDIEFEMSVAFGAKCSNVATMRRFGLPEGTIPNGFGIPFYFYDEFMKYNGFYDDVQTMINNPDFISDLETRIDMLKDFRKEIKDAPMPQWMLDELQAMHDMFPEGTSVRCRSSTNNEDLPGFSGAGLYTSKTQHPDEGHISKSVKQVYASMWNFRAYDERDFYRVDQYIAAMGILCHPNFEDEKSNGVGVSIDPVFNTENTFYLNTQVGEFLITNPDANSIPEEILLYQDPDEGYLVLRNSNLVPIGQLVMGEEYLNQMRDYLQIIHDEFALLYNVVGVEGFGMDIEYKVTAEDHLIIKQARPWVSFWADIKSTFDLGVEQLTAPATSASLGDAEIVKIQIDNKGIRVMKDFEISLFVDNQFVETLEISDEVNPQTSAEFQFNIPQDFSTVGDYDIRAIVAHVEDGYGANDTLDIVLSKLHLLEGGITIVKGISKCESQIDITANVTNYGESTFYDTEIEIIVNGLVVDTINYDFGIPYLVDVDILIPITENIQQFDNQITLNLLRVNEEQDAVLNNNTAMISTDLDSTHDYITIIINADNYPQETSWAIYDELNNELIETGELSPQDSAYAQEVCVDYTSCLSLTIFDSYGDGICCGYGIGDFLLTNSNGEILFTNNGEFGSQAIELFCPNGEGCTFTTDIETTLASNEEATDGTITINPIGGFAPYEFSIDGGATFVSNNTFTNLAPSDYMIVVRDASKTCFQEETITVDYDILESINDIYLGNIKVYPNPTRENFIIEIDESFEVLRDINIEIYDFLGRLTQSNTISRNSQNLKTSLSLAEYNSGSYIVKCYNENFEVHFKVIKI
ncbi:MAG TPA: hypothetical protein DCM04_02705 [Saprospirales bacterium]|nr:hypothetical protein [Saprospirales bacterium]|tara:strand:+ start:224 stop:3934 length:3711 start_codon:yes stop_codon:yes gene_type:complete